ncbi:MAG TPA: elongation factor P [Polyangiaceae bacterium]|jgi:elongation factor P|nr:MAG: Elongation factor P [Deltaproteobacteria bacterium ADurb.Bin207]HNS96297.1 elongation factor P [Polyangiaceae bacterium]HNZ22029.1 elongation factor P [Polyangiaceae bacterium]HOD22215.1 elongation factor P [Polyangiaceae bacterium]HOE47337.1 elongation factor P [Polyangiaceae bacterium]
MYDTSDIRKGLKIVLDGKPYTIVEAQFVKPGKGQAFTRTRIKNLQTGAVIDRTFRSGDKLEPADVQVRDMSFIYPDGDGYVFMDESGDQVSVPADVLGESSQFLSDGLAVEIVFFKGEAIDVTMPAHVVLEITHCDPGVRGDTASNVTKPATLSTGAVIQVPLFVNENEWVKVDTRTGAYMERVNKR